MQALEDIKILELVHLPPGELCTMVLGDLGANIIKVEPLPDAGRGAGIGAEQNEQMMKNGLAFNALNRNKKSIRLNLKSSEGQQVFYRLAKDADVVIEGFRPGVVKRLGIDYETVSQINPRIIYCSLSGYGQDGPYSQYPGHDVNYISIAGALNIIGYADRHPSIPQNFIGDYGGASMHGMVGILTAIIARQKTGKGQLVDISYADSSVSLMTPFLQQYFGGGVRFARGECIMTGGYPYYNTYEAKDGKLVSLACAEPWFWDNFCNAVGRKDLKAYGYKPEHAKDKPEGPAWVKVKEKVQKIFLTRTRDEWFDFLAPLNIPVGKVYSIDEVADDPQLKHRKMFVEFDHPEQGKIKQPGIAIKLSGTPGKVRSLAPLSGENTVEVLQSLGYSQQEIDGFRSIKVIG